MRIGTGRVAGTAVALAAGMALAGCWDSTAADDGYSSEDDWYEDEECYCDDEYEDPVDVLIVAGVDALFGDDGDDPPEAAPWRRARRDLMRATSDADGAARGLVEVRRRGWRERFRLVAVELPPFAAVEAWVSDGQRSMLYAGGLLADGDGTLTWRADADRGVSLPLAAASLRDLAGRRVEIRDGSSGAVLVGRVPFLSARGGRSVTESFRAAGSSARMRLSLESLGGGGRQAAAVVASRLPPGAEATLSLADSGGVQRPVASGAVSDSGRVTFRWDTRRGDPLPLGVLDLATLAGSRLELRVDGDVAVAGAVPPLR